MDKRPIIAYAVSGGSVVHDKCLHPFQAKHKDDRVYPAVQAGWHPGHPRLPLACAHCGRTIERGTEAV